MLEAFWPSSIWAYFLNCVGTGILIFIGRTTGTIYSQRLVVMSVPAIVSTNPHAGLDGQIAQLHECKPLAENEVILLADYDESEWSSTLASPNQCSSMSQGSVELL